MSDQRNTPVEATTQPATPPAKVRIVWKQMVESGRRTSWAKAVTGVSPTPGLKGAKVFVGPYLRTGEEIDLRDGQIVIEVYPGGSIKNATETARLGVVSAKAGKIEWSSERFSWHRQFLSFRDYVQGWLNGEITWEADSAGSDE